MTEEEKTGVVFVKEYYEVHQPKRLKKLVLLEAEGLRRLFNLPT